MNKGGYVDKIKNIINNPFMKLIMQNICILFVLFLLFEPTTKSDDYDMANLAFGGVDGKFSPFLLYSNVLFGYIIKGLLLLFPNVAWFYVVQYILMFCAVITISFVIYKRNTNKVATFLCTILVLFIGYEFFIRITFSKTSGLLAATGYLYFLYLIGIEKARFRDWLWAYTLIIFGIFIREAMFKGITLVFVSSFIIVFYKEFKMGFKSLLKKTLQFLVIVVSLFSISSGLVKITDGITNSDEVWGDYLRDNAIRSGVVDWGVPNYDLYEDEYKKIGISKNDYIMWFQLGNRCDEDILTNEKYQEILQIRENVVIDEEPKSQRVIDAIYRLLNYQKTNTMYYLLLITILVFFQLERKLVGLVAIAANGFCILAYLYLSYSGRTQHHVDASIYLAGAFIIVYFIETKEKENDYSIRKTTLIVSLAVIAFSHYFYSELTSSSYYGSQFGKIASQKEQYAENNKRLSLLSEDKEHFYVMSAYETNRIYSSFTVLEPIKKGFYHNIYRTNMNHIPVFDSVLVDYNIDNVWAKMTNSEQIFYVFTQACLSDIPVIQNYIQEHYNVNARSVLVKQIEDMYIYRFIDDTFSIDVSNAKKDIDDVTYSVEKVYDEAGNVTISGYAYIEGKDSYAQNVYIQAVNKKNGEYKIFTSLQTENVECRNNDKYNGKYSSFSTSIEKTDLKAAKLKKKNVEFNLLLEVDGELYKIPIEE